MFFGLPAALLALHRAIDAPSLGRGVVARPGARRPGAGVRLLRHLRRPARPRSACVFFGADARPLARADYWACGAVAAATAIGLVVPFFLPYVRVQSELGFTRSVEEAAVYSADVARLAGLERLGAPLDPAAGWATGTRCCSPASLTLVGGAVGRRGARGARPAAGVTAAARAPTSPGERPRDVLAFYALSGVLAFWISFGPAAGLYRVLFARDSGVLVPARAEPDRHRRGPGAGGAVRRAAWPRSFARLDAADAASASRRCWSLAMCRRALRGAARRARGAAGRSAPIGIWPRCRGRRSSSCRSSTSAPTSPATPRYMSASGWHWQPLINGYSDHIPPEFRELAPRHARLPVRGVVRRAARSGAPATSSST